jgi:hypothetical protein
MRVAFQYNLKRRPFFSPLPSAGHRIGADEVLMSNRKINPCKWYYFCPIKEYTEKGKLERYWIENYCLVNNNTCIRYQMQEKSKYHPDNMLPNGEIREDL